MLTPMESVWLQEITPEEQEQESSHGRAGRPCEHSQGRGRWHMTTARPLQERPSASITTQQAWPWQPSSTFRKFGSRLTHVDTGKGTDFHNALVTLVILNDP